MSRERKLREETNIARALGFDSYDTVDDYFKLQLLIGLFNRFGTSAELEAHLNKIDNCCGKKD